MSNSKPIDPDEALIPATLRLSGPDAQAFLQSQLTLDLNALAPSTLQPTAWCNANGRVALVLLLGRSKDGFDLVLPRELLPELERRIRLFRIGRKVEVVSGLGVETCPPDAPGALGLSYAPARAMRIDPAAPAGGLAELRQMLIDDIRHGMPWIVSATSDRFLPQMLGFDRLGGLSYRKGCYPGQEVIARVHYRGRVTRRCVRFRVETAVPPAPGLEFGEAALTATVLYVAADTEGRYEGLAVVPAEIETAALPGYDAENRTSGLEWLDTEPPEAYQER